MLGHKLTTTWTWTSIKETVNRALRQAGVDRRRSVKRRLDLLAAANLADREKPWR
jgi:hypothetical protein